MKKILLLINLCSALIFADEFIESGSTFGGYGELHWDAENEKMDFHRFVLFFSNTWDSQWSFKSELEIEHNMIDGSGDYDGEVELEQAYVNYYNGSLGFKGGVVLAPVGIINQTHEPPTFLSVERPLYQKYIIPTTWFSNGFSFYGNTGNINWEFAVMEDLDGYSMLFDTDDDGNVITRDYPEIREGRQKGYKSSAKNLTKSVAVSWTGVDGLKLGGSITINDAPVDDNNSLGVNLTELNATYSKNNIHTVFEYGAINYDFMGESMSSSGYYLDLGYNIGEMINLNGSLTPWIRTSSYSMDDDIDATTTDITLYGMTFKPNDNVSFKFDMGTKETNGTEADIFNIGIGYMF